MAGRSSSPMVTHKREDSPSPTRHQPPMQPLCSSSSWLNRATSPPPPPAFEATGQPFAVMPQQAQAGAAATPFPALPSAHPLKPVVNEGAFGSYRSCSPVPSSPLLRSPAYERANLGVLSETAKCRAYSPVASRGLEQSREMASGFDQLALNGGRPELSKRRRAGVEEHGDEEQQAEQPAPKTRKGGKKATPAAAQKANSTAAGAKKTAAAAKKANAKRQMQAETPAPFQQPQMPSSEMQSSEMQPSDFPTFGPPMSSPCLAPDVPGENGGFPDAFNPPYYMHQHHQQVPPPMPWHHSFQPHIPQQFHHQHPYPHQHPSQFGHSSPHHTPYAFGQAGPFPPYPAAGPAFFNPSGGPPTHHHTPYPHGLASMHAGPPSHPMAAHPAPLGPYAHHSGSSMTPSFQPSLAEHEFQQRALVEDRLADIMRTDPGVIRELVHLITKSPWYSALVSSF